MRHKKTTTILLLTVASLLSIIFLLPLVWMILTSFKTLSDSLESASLLPKYWTLENYRLILNASSESPLLRWLLNTTIVTVLGTLLVLFVDVLAAYALARLQIPGRKIILAIVVIASTIPGIVTLFPAFYLFRQAELLDSYVPLIVPYAAGTLGVFLIYNILRTFPKDLEEAAYLDGASQWQVMTKVILPTLRSIITKLGIVTFLAIYNDFLWPSLATNEAEMKTMTLGIATLVQGSNFVNPAAMMASTVIATLPALLLFFWANPFFVKGITHSGLK
jgi:multiple sugar transport system permease protein